MAITVVLIALLFLLNANLAQKTGLNRFVYSDIDLQSVPLLADVSQDVTLDFLDEHPQFPRRFFAVRWEGFWYVPETRAFTLHGAGDDRLDVWIDGEFVIRRWPPADMHTEIRTVELEAGLHELRVEYQQHGGVRNLRFEYTNGDLLPPVTSARFFHELPDASAVQLARRIDQLTLAAVGSLILPVLSGAVFLSTRKALEAAKRIVIRLGYGRLDLVALVGLMAVALPLAIATGSRYDYPYYESHWGLVLRGADPWATTNAYGPAYNLLAVAFAFHPLLPKVIFVLGWLSCCSYLLRKLANSGVGMRGLAVWSAALPLNPLFWVLVVLCGVLDALVGTLCILALALLPADRRVTAGVMLGLAVLLKFYPIVMAPFIAIHDRRIDLRFATGLVGTLVAGFAASVLVWGSSTFDPIVAARSWESGGLSVFRFLTIATEFLGWTGNVDQLSLPAMALAGGVAVILCWRWRLPREAGAFVGVLVTLALYQVGATQYFIVVPLLSAYWYAHRHPSASHDALLIGALVACLTWLAFVAVLDEATRPTGGRWGMVGEWEFLRDWLGLPTFATMVSLIVTLMRYERREAQAAERTL